MKDYDEIKNYIQNEIQLRKENKQLKNIEVLTLINKNINKILNPAYVKYTKEDSMSAIDPSYIHSQIHEGMRKPKLSNKMLKFKNQYDTVYEYGFNDNNQCLYRKVYTQDGDVYFDNYYLYLKNTIYRVKVKSNRKIKSIEDYHCIDDFQYSLIEEYVFDDKGRPLQIINHYMCLGIREDYQWIDNDVAIVKMRLNKYLFIKDNEDVIAIFSIEYGNLNQQIFSYQNQDYIDLNHYTLQSIHIIKHSSLHIEYSFINDRKEKPTEYLQLKILDKIYIVSINYMKPPAGFSYKKAKELYQKEIIDFIENKMNELDFEIRMIGIQYYNYGYSIVAPFIGFDKGDNEDVQTMTECIEYEFPLASRDIISQLDNYIKIHGYYQSFQKLMISIKKQLENQYQIEVILDEITD